MNAAEQKKFSYGFAKKHGIVALDWEAGTVGFREGGDPAHLLEARRVLGRKLACESLTPRAFDRCLSEIYGHEGLASVSEVGEGEFLLEAMPNAADLLDSQDDAPIIKLINGLIAEAVRKGVSDIHIEPFEAALTVRFRLDGVLREALSLPVRLAAPIVSRIKVMARLDIAEKRLPQDGRISLTLGGKTLDVRVSTLPSRGGERVVMRILDKDQASLKLEELGMPAQVLSAFEQALRFPNGIILVTGPTGSGKTTTLYAGLSLLNNATRNILTIEDPVEYAIDGVGQTQVNTKVGMHFATGLRAILRQDPDVVMVGEIRDGETAQVAVQASLTGHLVLSTVHTNDAVGAVTRLRDMGVEPFLLASSLRLVLAQRLVRKLCPLCMAPHSADARTASALGIPVGSTVHRAVGCEACGHAGYAGRVGVYEAIRIDDTIRGMIGENAAEEAIAAASFAQTENLTQAARAYVLSGTTTPEEALRVTRQENQTHAGI